MFMATEATAPDQTPPLSPSGRLLSLVRKLIGYGTQLAASFRQRNTAAVPEDASTDFGTSSIAVILARIALAVHRARVLEARIIRIAPRLDADTPNTSPLPRISRASRPGVPHVTQPKPPADQLPTVEQIAARVRRQPIGAVFADICRDLGIRPGHSLWRELQRAILLYGGNYARLVIEHLDRVCPIAGIVDRLRRKPSMPSIPAGTGPPAIADEAA